MRIKNLQNNIFIDPYEFGEELLPIAVLTDDRRGWLGFLIKNHSAGNYNHAMELHETGYFASQDPGGYREVAIRDYKKPFILMKFWAIKNATLEQKKLWKEIIEADLNAPWRLRAYDFLGIIGQALNLPWLQNPHKRFCSERVAEHLRMVFNVDLPKHPTPSGLNELFKEDANMECVGYYFMD